MGWGSSGLKEKVVGRAVPGAQKYAWPCLSVPRATYHALLKAGCMCSRWYSTWAWPRHTLASIVPFLLLLVLEYVLHLK